MNTICYSNWILSSVIVFSGIIAGSINHLTNRSIERVDEENKNSFKIKNKNHLLLEILLGICGAALIPLFLHLTSSKLFEECENKFFPYFIFVGYCLIGAIFSRSLLDGLAKRLDLQKIKNEVRNVRKETEDAKKELAKVERIAKSEFEDLRSQGKEVVESLKKNPSDNLTQKRAEKLEFLLGRKDGESVSNFSSSEDFEAKDELQTILNFIQGSDTENHSVSTVSKKTNIPEYLVEKVLIAFEQKGILFKRKWYGNFFYTLTQEGKEITIVD